MAYLSLTRFYVFFIIIFLCSWFPFRFFTTPGTMRHRYTYELPAAACVNELTSDLWTFENVRERLFVLYLLVPFSICLMVWSREKVGWATHLVVVCVGMAWNIVMLGFDIVDLRDAHVAPSDPSFRPQNLARDPQWCLFYAGQPNTALLCANPGLCGGPAVDPAKFRANQAFLLRFIFNIFLFALGVGALWAATVWKRTYLSPPKKVVDSSTSPPRYNILKSK